MNVNHDRAGKFAPTGVTAGQFHTHAALAVTHPDRIISPEAQKAAKYAGGATKHLKRGNNLEAAEDHRRAAKQHTALAGMSTSDVEREAHLKAASFHSGESARLKTSAPSEPAVLIARGKDLGRQPRQSLPTESTVRATVHTPKQAVTLVGGKRKIREDLSGDHDEFAHELHASTGWLVHADKAGTKDITGNIARAVAHVVNDLHDRGYDLSGIDKFTTKYWNPSVPNGSHLFKPAWAGMPQETTIVLPHEAAQWKRNVKTAPKGWSSTSTVHGTVYHEIAHHLHYRNNAYNPPGGELLPNEKRLAKRRVSQYASTNKKEFVAEVFSGTMEGKTYDADVMAIYTKYGGPTILLKKTV